MFPAMIKTEIDPFPPDSSTHGGGNHSISEVISNLRTSFRPIDFDRAESYLVAREESLRREIQRLVDENQSAFERRQLDIVEILELRESLAASEERLSKVAIEREELKKKTEEKILRNSAAGVQSSHNQPIEILDSDDDGPTAGKAPLNESPDSKMPKRKRYQSPNESETKNERSLRDGSEFVEADIKRVCVDQEDEKRENSAPEVSELRRKKVECDQQDNILRNCLMRRAKLELYIDRRQQNEEAEKLELYNETVTDLSEGSSEAVSEPSNDETYTRSEKNENTKEDGSHEDLCAFAEKETVDATSGGSDGREEENESHEEGDPANEDCTEPMVIPIRELDSLEMILKDEDHFSVSITIRSRFEWYCKLIKSILNEKELQRFKTTQFGHLIDIPDQYQHSNQLLWYFILRQIKTKKEREIWMMVNKIPMRFSMEEYILITGLNFTSLPGREKLKDKAKGHTRLVKKYFDTGRKVTVVDLVNQFGNFTKTSKINTDKIKIALLLFLHGVLFGYTRMKSIKQWSLGLVDNIHEFDSFDWGVKSYKYTIKALKKDIKAKADEQTEFSGKSIEFMGFVHAFQIWIYEMVPAIANTYAELLDENRRPRILRWKTKSWNIKYSPRLSDIENIVQEAEIKHSLMIRTKDEQMMYLSTATQLLDKDDPIIDSLTEKLKSGALIQKDTIVRPTRANCNNDKQPRTGENLKHKSDSKRPITEDAMFGFVTALVGEIQSQIPSLNVSVADLVKRFKKSSCHTPTHGRTIV